MSCIKPKQAAAIVRDAGGKITGQSRLQKTAYLLAAVGLDDGFWFIYRQEGPHSDDLAMSAMMGTLLGNLSEQERQADWGGTYSIYSVDEKPDDSVPPERLEFARTAALENSVVLELAATAVFLFKDGYEDPWAETERRKPVKVANGRLDKAKNLFERLKKIKVPEPLPDFA